MLVDHEILGHMSSKLSKFSAGVNAKIKLFLLQTSISNVKIFKWKEIMHYSFIQFIKK